MYFCPYLNILFQIVLIIKEKIKIILLFFKLFLIKSVVYTIIICRR